MKKCLAQLFRQQHRSIKVNSIATQEAQTPASLILPGELLEPAEAGKYSKLENKINTQGGLCYRRLADITQNGDTLVHLIARNDPKPFSLARDLVVAINFLQLCKHVNVIC